MSPEKWMEVWPEALEIWGRYIKLKEPRFTRRKKIPGKDSATPLAYIDLRQMQVVVGMDQVERYGLQDLSLEILAHEVGHHVFAPGDLLDAGRCISRIRKSLRELAGESAIILNMYTDLLINHRLQSFGLSMDQVYRRMRSSAADPLWDLYMRTYEILWKLPADSLCSVVDEETEADAAVAAQVIRSFAADVVRGSGMFGAICYYYLKKNGSARARRNMEPMLDAEHSMEEGQIPDGLVESDEDEDAECSYPVFDESGEWKNPKDNEADKSESGSGGRGQTRMPLDYHQILEAMGIKISAEEAAMQYYREKARPYLVPFPVSESVESTERQLEGYEVWQPGQMLERINWFQTLLRSPVVIPGYTTVQNRYGTSPGPEKGIRPVDLDLYVDCSGSMPRPTISLSYPTLAGAIIALSALRAGARVQATLWSGPDQWLKTDGFVRDEKEILKVLVGYFGGGTAFPLHVLRKTYLEQSVPDRKVHLLVISDEGVDTIFQNDELGNAGEQIAKQALEKAGGGGTFALQLYSSWEKNQQLIRASELGFRIHEVGSAEDLTRFARSFAKARYGKDSTGQKAQK